jgi:hypothetical protein
MKSITNALKGVTENISCDSKKSRTHANAIDFNAAVVRLSVLAVVAGLWVHQQRH